jgi:hypothetical protein
MSSAACDVESSQMLPCCRPAQPGRSRNSSSSTECKGEGHAAKRQKYGDAKKCNTSHISRRRSQGSTARHCEWELWGASQAQHAHNNALVVCTASSKTELGSQSGKAISRSLQGDSINTSRRWWLLLFELTVVQLPRFHVVNTHSGVVQTLETHLTHHLSLTSKRQQNR